MALHCVIKDHAVDRNTYEPINDNKYQDEEKRDISLATVGSAPGEVKSEQCSKDWDGDTQREFPGLRKEREPGAKRYVSENSRKRGQFADPIHDEGKDERDQSARRGKKLVFSAKPSCEKNEKRGDQSPGKGERNQYHAADQTKSDFGSQLQVVLSAQPAERLAECGGSARIIDAVRAG